MSTRRYEREEAPPRSKCISCLCFSWKVFTVIFSHVTLIALVVAYSVAGAFLFQRLEAENEISVSRIFDTFLKVKAKIAGIRKNVTEKIYEQTLSKVYLEKEDWTSDAIKKLQDFETSILKAMKEEGWDGYEPDANKTQWTFTGSLFYSIIVITTIGESQTSYKFMFTVISIRFCCPLLNLKILKIVFDVHKINVDDYDSCNETK
ncbi:CLUMA_CG005361, isoform A [Clunio marinus]|uniref:CLUMA_CG005361, isoform A n=1 Tax=Clunio marinus TaxID=568069 RepID=A0A1J1HYW1_9DIPT|nr:CLUMA_CG005361, isoform A [Clunio marinus]